MRTLREKLDELLRQGTRDAQVELYHWELSRAGPRARLLVYIDRPQGVTLKDCERASRAIEALLDAEDPIPSSYVLEVSSPGVERGLWEKWHYERALGKRVRVVVKVARDGRHVYEGKLAEVRGEEITVELDKGRIEIPFPEIARAHVVFEPEAKTK